MIRKLLSGLLAGLLTVSLCACGGDDTRGEDSQKEAQASETDRNGEQAQEQETQGQGDAGKLKILIAYFTWAENAVPDENVDATASPSVTEPYSSDWDECLDRANGENRDNIHPELEAVLESTADYDTVFIGYPIWWGIAAWPVDTFVEANDFAGKTVIPFCTSSSSGIGDSGELLADLAGTGDWRTGERFRSGADESDVQEWVNGLGL